MPQKNPNRKAVKVLRDSVARRIAAGEVIDRPASVVRELLDNAIDAGSSEIAVYIEEGGVGRIRVIDNGSGMTQEDLKICCLPHATSKIETEDDLYRVTSLGFRGEALASIVTVARTEITSRTENSDTANKIVIHGGEQLSFEPSKGNPGTVVDVADLFYAIPARRRFMKTASAETSQCKAVFLEKAAAFPEINFKFFTDGKLKVFLPAGDILSRVSAAYEDMDKRFLHLQTGKGEKFSLSLAAGTLDITRRDRKYIQIYINRRRIWEYSLSQGVEYAYSHYIPGGRFPCCFVFVEISPELVDFNIHPAKKEAKIKNVADIRYRVSEILDSFLRQLNVHNRVTSVTNKSDSGESATAKTLPFAEEKKTGVYPSYSTPSSGTFYHQTYSKPLKGTQKSGYQDLLLGEAQPFTEKKISQNFPNTDSTSENTIKNDNKKYDFIYRGQVLGLFLIAEKEEILYLVDQHAAHERIVYESFASDTVSQPLLIPYEFDTDEEEDSIVEKNVNEITKLGIEVSRLEPRRWVLTALPGSFHGAEGDIVHALISQYGAADSLKKELFVNLACKKAIKDGDPIDPLSACEIINAAFSMENPRCPHGRPIWFAISREELFRKVERIV